MTLVTFIILNDLGHVPITLITFSDLGLLSGSTSASVIFGYLLLLDESFIVLILTDRSMFFKIYLRMRRCGCLNRYFIIRYVNLFLKNFEISFRPSKKIITVLCVIDISFYTTDPRDRLRTLGL